MFTRELKVGGCLIGWALKKKDGRYFEKRFKNPIHNTITKSCINNMFEYNGAGSGSTNNYVGYSFLVTYNGTNYRYGILNSCALGDGTGTTSVDDVSLKHQVGGYTTTKQSGSGWCGYGYSITDGFTWSRVSHKHTITENFTIKEIGWFFQVYPNGSYSLSARVQLDDFVPVETGDTFYSIYQIKFNYNHEAEKVNLPTFGTAWHIVNGRNYSGVDGTVVPVISEYGYGASVTTREGYKLLCPIFVPSNNFDFKFWGSSYPAQILQPNGQIQGTPYATSFTVTSKTDLPYTLDSFYRDTELLIAAPNTPVYAIHIMRNVYLLGDYDENNNFVNTPWNGQSAIKIKIRQRISTDLLTPAG